MNVKTNEKANEKPYAQKLIPLIVAMVIIYAIADIVLQVLYQTEISSTLTTCWFAFWGVEIINLAVIKVGKNKTIRNASDFGEIKEEVKEEAEENLREWSDNV